MFAAETLDLVHRLYLGLQERDPYPTMLSVLLTAFEARQGLAVVASHRDESPMVGATRGLNSDAFDVPGDDTAWHALFEGAPIRFDADLTAAERASLPLEGELLVIVARHTGRGLSLWAVSRRTPFSAEARERAQVLAANLDHAVQMALIRGRAPRGSAIRTGTGDLGPLLRTLAQRPSGAFTKRVDGLFAPSPRPEKHHTGEVGGRRRRTTLGELKQPLAPRTLRCARLAAEGRTDEEIAGELRVSETTVSRELQRAYRHFGVRGRRELDVTRLVGD